MDIDIYQCWVHSHGYWFLNGLSSFCMHTHAFIIRVVWMCDENPLKAGWDVSSFWCGINMVDPLEGVCECVLECPLQGGADYDSSEFVFCP